MHHLTSKKVTVINKKIFAKPNYQMTRTERKKIKEQFKGGEKICTSTSQRKHSCQLLFIKVTKLIFMEIKIKMKYYCTNSSGKNFNVSPCIAITVWEYGAIRTLTNFWWESNLDRTIFKRLTNLHEVKDMHFTTQQIFPEELRSLLHLSTEDCTLFFFYCSTVSNCSN